MRRLLLRGTVGVLLFVLAMQPASVLAGVVVKDSPDDSTSTTAALIITEVKLGGATTATTDTTSDQAIPTPPKEYVTIYNQSSEAIDFTDTLWQLQYVNDLYQGSCSALPWSGSGSKVVVLSGEAVPPSGAMSIELALTDTRSGTVQLVAHAANDTVTIHDAVSWGAASPCSTTAIAAPLPAPGMSIHRFMACDEAGFIATGDDAADFFINETPQFGLITIRQLAECTASDTIVAEHEDTTPEISEPELSATSCAGLQLSELLPNPAGSDAGAEYIELYNPTAGGISLHGCALQTSANAKLFVIADELTLASGAYIALYNDQTGLTLVNSAGGTVWLIDADGLTELDAATYPPNMVDDTVWIRFDGMWQTSYAPTPAAPNVVMPLKPCATGQVRNELTGRCVTATVTTTALAECGEGRERNPETNRCRSVLAATTTLVPCDADEYRNPDTNRCRNIESATSSLVPCEDGYERNPDTNRCRKIVTTSEDIASVTDIQAGERASMAGWWVAAGVICFALGYAAYEWRHEARQLLRRFIPIRRK